MSKRDKQEKKLLTPGNIAFGIGLTTLMGMAIGEQLRLPPQERTWQGKIFGIPYDFRKPTLERLRATFWNADNDDLLAPKFFGMGWDFNLYPVFHQKIF